MTFTSLIILVVFILSLKFILKSLKQKKKSSTKSEPKNLAANYEAIPTLLTKTELIYFKALKEALPDTYHISTKVRWADVFKVKKGIDKKSTHGLFRRIVSKHIDFVLISPDTGDIKCLIELDDASHNSASVQKRDKFQGELAEHCNVPLVRQAVKSSYKGEAIKESIFQALDLCHKCGSQMVKRERVHESGKKFPFLGCESFPSCDLTKQMSFGQ